MSSMEAVLSFPILLMAALLEQQFERELNGSRLIALVTNRSEAGIGHSGIARASKYSLEGCPVERVEPIAPELHV